MRPVSSPSAMNCTPRLLAHFLHWQAKNIILQSVSPTPLGSQTPFYPSPPDHQENHLISMLNSNRSCVSLAKKSSIFTGYGDAGRDMLETTVLPTICAAWPGTVLAQAQSEEGLGRVGSRLGACILLSGIRW